MRELFVKKKKAIAALLVFFESTLSETPVGTRVVLIFMIRQAEFEYWLPESSDFDIKIYESVAHSSLKLKIKKTGFLEEELF